MNKKKFIIFGGDRLNEDMPVTYLLNYLKKNKIKYLLVTDPIHLNKPTKSNKSFKKNIKKFRYISFIKFEKNKILKLIDKNTYGFSLNAIWKFPEEIIKKFNKRLYNYHAADLPGARGAGNVSWKILNDNYKKISINIHYIDKDFDTGDIIQTKKIKLKSNYLPKDILTSIACAEKSFLIDFINRIIKNKKMVSKKQKGEVFYWPRLNSKRDGQINWNWDAKSIVFFIKAFSYPFNGAFSFLNQKKIYIFNAKFIKKKFHPFTNGLIFKENKKKVFVANSTGYIEIFKRDLKFRKKMKSFIGKRFK